MKKQMSYNLKEPHTTSYDDNIKTISKVLPHTDNATLKDLKEPIWKCRYVMTLTGFLVFLLVSVYRTVTSVAIVAMVNNTAITRQSKAMSDSCPNLLMNATVNDLHNVKMDGEFIWSPKIQGYILGSYFVGFVVAQMPSGILAERYGCKWILFTSLLVSGFLTLLIPPLSWISSTALIAVQVIRGLAGGFVIPIISVLTSNWFPKLERGSLYAIMYSGASLGTCVGGIITGYMCESVGWPSTFYSSGAAGLVLAISIIYFVAENPNVHPRISEAERNYILCSQESALSRKRPKLPWRKVLTSVPVYALLYAVFGRGWAVSHFWTVHSTFLGTILHYPIGQNGLLTALPFALQFVFAQLAAWISLYMQKKNIVGIDFLRKFWTIFPAFGFSISLLGMYFAGCNRSLSVVCSILSTGFTGLGSVGCLAVATDMTPTFAGTLFSVCSFLGFLTCFIIPVEVGYLTNDMQTLEQWNKVFFISIGVVMSSAILFVIFGSAEVQPWNFVEEENKEKDGGKENMKNENNERISRF